MPHVNGRELWDSDTGSANMDSRNHVSAAHTRAIYILQN